ncbi:uncharacterized protein LOC122391500 [Amphibalanus amphitrite]|uniref:uncharacterized protein LOC122391500 n=1 Tax=Amphibalanus amphitrite TaxID=1232801 RepID=UPI001C90AE8F|nr:uncharacterized protein LOC122391500 [Amphibalanus amphitrite]
MPKRKLHGQRLAPSEIKVRCGHPGCKFYGRPDTFKIHNNRKHGGHKNARVKNSGFEPGAKFACYAPLPLASDGALESGETTAAAAESMDCGPPMSPVHESVQLEAEDSDNPPANNTSEARGGDGAAPAGPSRELADLFSAMKSVALQVKRNESKLNEIIDILRKGSVTTAKIGQKRTDETSEAAKLLIRSGRSIAALQVATDNLLTQSPDEGLIACSACVPSGAVRRRGAKGVFTYDFNLGTSFADGQSLPSSFRHLRAAIRSHFCGLHHGKTVLAKKQTDELAKGRFARNASAASHVLRTGYFVLKRSLPRASFEDLVVLQAENGTRVGNTNHSSMFVPTMRLQFSTVMTSMLQRFIEQQPCVSMCADKVTVAKRTIDITAVIAVVSGAPAGHMIQSFVVAAPVVKDHSGDGLADELCQSLVKVGVTHPDKLAAICMDGQYHHNRVPEKLLSRLRATDPRFNTAPSVVVLWDGAHLLNLAEDDARRSNGCEWVEKVIAQVTGITKRYTVELTILDSSSSDITVSSE